MTSPSKICIKCSTEKPLSEFYSHPQMRLGTLNKCKVCVRAYAKMDRALNPEKFKKREAKRNKKPHRKQRVKDYLSTDKGKIIRSKISKNYQVNNQKKRNASTKVRRAIEAGEITKKPCEVCGHKEIVHAHHCDYNKPLEVMWLCPKHHYEWHKKHGPGLNGHKEKKAS